MDRKAIEYVRTTLNDYRNGNKQNGETVEEFIKNADYDIQKEVEIIFTEHLMPIPNNGEVLMSQQKDPLNPLNQQLRILNMQGIERKLDYLTDI